MSELEQNITTFLSTQSEPIPTLQIAKGVGLKTCKEVNPTLYGMEKKKLITKSSEPDGSKPKWSYSKT